MMTLAKSTGRFLWPLLLGCFPLEVNGESAQVLDLERMKGLRSFAEAALQHGRDTYGKKHSPLFVDSLEVSTMKAPEKMYIHRLGGPGPRSKQPFQPVISSNLAYQGNLMRFLVGISNLTGDARFEEAYKESLRYCFRHYAVPNGLLQMGHHRWVNLNTDDPCEECCHGRLISSRRLDSARGAIRRVRGCCRSGSTSHDQLPDRR